MLAGKGSFDCLTRITRGWRFQLVTLALLPACPCITTTTAVTYLWGTCCINRKSSPTTQTCGNLCNSRLQWLSFLWQDESPRWPEVIAKTEKHIGSHARLDSFVFFLSRLSQASSCDHKSPHQSNQLRNKELPSKVKTHLGRSSRWGGWPWMRISGKWQPELFNFFFWIFCLHKKFFFKKGKEKLVMFVQHWVLKHF